MKEFYLYKLTTGETVIGEFLRAETINERTGEVAHIVRYPMKVPSGRYDELCEWIPGCLDIEIPISLNRIIFIVSGDQSLDSVLVEAYQYAIGE